MVEHRQTGFGKKSLTLGVAALAGLLAIYGCSTLKTPAPDYSASPQFNGEKFFNVDPEKKLRTAPTSQIWQRFLFGEKVDTVPANGTFEVPELDLNVWAKLDHQSVHWARLGHSSILLKLHGKNWLLDPVFSERTSPVQWVGPKRFHKVPLVVEQMPEIEGIILSHDHYDHLDYHTIMALKNKVKTYVTPLGVGQHLINWGIDPTKVHQLDWWQERKLDHLQLIAAPAQHFSGRGLNDRDHTLWASWVILSEAANGATSRIYFSGDGGYGTHFKEIGKRFGPFDYTFMETGAYDQMWPGVHMMPEETAQAHLEVGGEILVPVHNGTFDLAFHPWKEPFERISQIAEAQGIAVAAPEMGVVVSQGLPPINSHWWRDK